MSTQVRLSTTSYVVLGLIALRGPSTPYDLKRAIGHSIGYFWPFPHTQLYTEPARLADEGLLTLHTEEAGRRRKTYTITQAGRDAVRAWLQQPTHERLELRNPAELKLFFSELGDPHDVQALAREQASLHEQRLAELNTIADRFQGRTDLAPRLIPLTLGRRLEQAALGFWRELQQDIDDHHATEQQ